MASQKLTYKNKSKQVQSLIGYGKVLPGGTISVDEPIYNPNFILVDGGRMTNVEAPAEQPSKKGKQ